MQVEKSTLNINIHKFTEITGVFVEATEDRTVDPEDKIMTILKDCTYDDLLYFKHWLDLTKDFITIELSSRPTPVDD
jgi:hypothetical protein